MKIKKRVIKFLTISIILYAAYCAILFFFQQDFIYPGQYITPPDSSLRPYNNIETIYFHEKDQTSEGWYLPSVKNRKEKNVPVVIYAHGNYEIIDQTIHQVKGYNNIGVDILLLEYPGYGRSTGSPSEDIITKLFTKAYDWLINVKKIDKSRIIVHGRSLGGGAACSLSTKRDFPILILESTFTGLDKFAKKHLVPAFLLKDRFDNLSAVKNFRGPILLLHGINDFIVPFENSIMLNQSADNAQLIKFECGHNDLPPNKKKYWKIIQTFLENNSILNSN